MNQHNHKKIDDIIKRIEEKEELTIKEKSGINSEKSEKYFRAKYQLGKSLWKLHRQSVYVI